MEASNAKAIREALEFIKLASDDYEKYGNTKAGALDLIYEKACAALTATPRNCDIGTAEEQDRRFAYQFCRVGIEGCINCKLNTLKHRGNTCGIHWAQMPYEGGTK